MNDTYERDGLKYCKNCRTPRQAIIELPGSLFGGNEPVVRTVGCLCKCQAEERDKKTEEDRKLQEMYRMQRLIDNGLHDKALRDCTFEKAIPGGENMDKAQKYVDEFDKFKADGIGMMFYGEMGNGKTYTAACIANALLRKGIPVCMTTTAKILAMDFEERAYFIQNQKKYRLLIIDDFGVEHSSEYAVSQIYTLVDERYKSGLPMIVTTNLLPSTMQNEEDMDKARIYSRVQEMCLPVKFTGENRRAALKQEKMATAKQIFLG